MPQNCVAICKILNHSSLFILLSPYRECVVLAPDKSNHCASQNTFIIVIIYYYLSCLLCVMFFHAQRTGRCFPSARCLNFRSQGKKKEKKREKNETIKNEEMQCAREWRWPLCTGTCVPRSLETELMALVLSSIGEKTLGTAIGDFTTVEVPGKLYTIVVKDLFRRLRYHKMLGRACTGQGQLLPVQPFFILLAFCLPTISPWPIGYFHLLLTFLPHP